MTRLIAAPISVGSADEMLEIARSVVDEEAQNIEDDPKNEISCAPGCSSCCSQAVPVQAAELRAIHNFIRELPLDKQREVQRRISRAADELELAGLGTVEVPDLNDPTHADFRERYFRAGVPCPLLDRDGTCSVRPVRPLACREYLVSSDPVHCESGNEQIVRIRSTRDIVAGFTRIAEHFGEVRTMVLAPALASTVSSAPAHPTPGVLVLQLLTSQRTPR